ncbi:MAG: T9SS type A sorting domain-containing protein [Candidatus Marinimicrobia bacterium]|nr:T9SS type A sorting domain-containing protein [Candidatus Neomarinimicrobiota bacterium]
MRLKQQFAAVLILLLLPASLLFSAGDTLSINIMIRDVVAIDEVFIPTEYALHPPYPNPFNPDVNLTVDIPEQSETRISILNVLGQEVAVLETRELQPGRYQYQWQAAGYPSGIYFVRVHTGQFETSEKISLLK